MKFIYPLLFSFMFIFSSCVSSDSENNNNSNTGSCGNGIIEADEVCDSDDLDGKTCQDFNYTEGTLVCQDDCNGYITNWCLPQNTNNNNNNNNNTWVPPTDSRIYVHTKYTLFYIDPGVSDNMVEIGNFIGNCIDNDSGFYDIALTSSKRMYGITANALYTVDKETAECTVLVQFPEGSPHFFALSYVKAVDPENPDREELMAASAEDGEWVMIKPSGETINEMFHHVGYYDYPAYDYVSSGDIVSVQTGINTYKTYATLKCGNYNETGCDSDWLAEIDPETGDARLIGQTGYQQIFALGYWGDKVYGFTTGGEYILIDVETAQSTEVNSYQDQQFWGAGNTTIPYIVE